MTGRFVWFELLTKDANRAQGFFGELFGWSAKTVPMPGGDYTMIAAPDGRTIGGYADGEGGRWLPYLRVPSAADAAAQVGKLGGKVVKPAFKIGDFATMAVLADPHGAEFAVWQPAKVEDPGAPAVGHFGWCELASKDPAASVAFYRALGGFTAREMAMPDGAYHLLESEGAGRAGIMAQHAPQPTAWVPYVLVASADATAAKAQKLGAALVVPPTDIPDVGRFAIFANPQGHATGILQSARG
jgi:predicted enzyme related to lactoylglutathione lyase